MKKNILLKTLAVFACMFSVLNANAARPIWLVGHACNSEQCLIDALADGANGVEIDVNSNVDNCRVDWSINHDSGYFSPEARKAKNTSEGRTGTRRYVSLEEYLNFAAMDKIAFLWLDIKTPDNNTVIGLVEHIHKILDKRYGDGTDYSSLGKVPYSIFFNFYHQDQLTVEYEGLSALKWYASRLRPNEALGLGREGSTNYKYSTETLENLEKVFADFPKEKHMMTNGYGWPYGPPYSWRSQISESLIKAKEWRDAGRYCHRTGTWTMEQPRHGLQVIISGDISYHTSWLCECDVVLMECRNEFFPAMSGLPGFNRNSLHDFVEWFFKEGCWRDYNNGRYYLARPLTSPDGDVCFREW